MGPRVLAKKKKSDPKDMKIGKLESLLGSTTMDNELLRERIEMMETGRHFVHRRSMR